MKTIKLNVNKHTFQKYLLELGFSFKIKHFGRLINEIKLNIYNDLNIKNILLDDILSNSNKVKIQSKHTYRGIHASYLNSLIKDGKLDEYLISEEFICDESIKVAAFKLDFLNRQDKEVQERLLKTELFKEISVKSSLFYSKSVYCFLSNKFLLLFEKEKELYSQFNESMKNN